MLSDLQDFKNIILMNSFLGSYQMTDSTKMRGKKNMK